MRHSVPAAWFLTACILVPTGAEARSKHLDALTGFDQSFTTGYTYRTFRDDFQETEGEAYRIAETPKEELESAVSETEQIERGDWTYGRSASVGTVYQTNPTGQNHDPQDDVSQTLLSTLGMSRRANRCYIQMFYDLSYTNNVVFEESNRATHAGKVNLSMDLNRLQIELSDNFMPSSAKVVGRRTELVATDNSASSVSTLTNAATADFRYRFSERTSLDFKYTNDLLYFPVPSGLDSSPNAGFSRQTHRIQPGVTYRLFPRTMVTASYGFERADFFQGGAFGSRTYDGTLGVGTRLGSHMGITGSLTLNRIEYEDPSTPPLRGHAISFGVSRKLTPKIIGTLTATSTVLQDFDTINNQKLRHTESFTGASFVWTLSPKLSAGLNGSVGVSSREGFITLPDPENPTLTFTREQEDVLYEWGWDLTWRPRKFMDVVLAYDFTNANSSFVDFESANHRLGGSLNLVY